MSGTLSRTTSDATVIAEHAASANEIKSFVDLVQDVMKSVMKPDMHYGVVPGTQKPSLLKPGAEVLCTTFRIAPTYEVDDHSNDDHVRVTVTCRGTHQNTGILMGEGVGSCSSMEEKYKWRAAVNEDEFAETPVDRRRVKRGKRWNNSTRQREPFEAQQVRTEPWDQHNTILKMASKRALVAMVLNVTAASDMFTQDMEDEPNVGQQSSRPAPQSTGNNDGFATEKQQNLLMAKCSNAKIELAKLCEHFNITAIGEMKFAKVNEALKWIEEEAVPYE